MIWLRSWQKIAAWFLTFVASALSLLSAVPIRAQVVGATLSGTVKDNSGAVIPKAQLSIENVATGVTRTAVTDADGFYSTPNLSPGSYDVTATGPGFKSYLQSGVVLTVGAEQTLNITMQVGEISQRVEVTGEAPIVQLASSDIGTVVSSTTVVELPLNGRDWAQLTSLQPGVDTLQTQVPNGSTAPRGNRGFGTQMTIAGTRPQLNDYRLDGISIVDYSGGSPASVLAQTLGVDAIGEFSVITANSSAEYGRSSGGVINAVTRAGANQFHGSAYLFLRDEGWDARSYFDTAIPPFHRDQFGGSVGGPIQKDKTFFFVNYEGFRQAQGVTNLDLVPSQNARNGIISTAGAPVTSCPAGTTLFVPGQSNVCVYNTVVPFLKFWPLPTTLVGAGDVGHAPVVTNAVGTENFWTNRIDRRFSEKDSIAGSWFYDSAVNSLPDPLDTVLTGNKSLRAMVTAEETHVFNPSLVNSVRIGYSRIHMIQNSPISAIDPLATDTSGSVSAVAGRPAPAITVGGITGFLGGLGEASLNTQIWNSYQLDDDAFLTKGVHSLKFGFVAENMRHAPHNITYLNGSWFFSGLTQFLSNQPLSVREPASYYGVVGLRQTRLGGYVQDDWRFRQNLTLNLGLRYEMSTVPTEAHNQLANLRTLTASAVTLGAPLFQNPTLRNFEPRAGFAWDPYGNGKTSVRGAFGMFDVLPLIYEFFVGLAGGAPFFPVGPTLPQSLLARGSFPDIATLPVLPQATASVGTTQFNPNRNYVMVWNLNIQHQLTSTTAVTLGFVGNRGIHMFEPIGDANFEVPAATTSAGYPLFPSPLGRGPNFNPKFTSIGLKDWHGDAYYSALEAQITKRVSHGLQFEASYTWGRNIDTDSAATISDQFTNSVSSPIWFCSVCRRGLSDFNVSQKLVGDYVWDLPTPKTWGALSSHVLGGWEVGGIITAESGTPVTPLMSGDPEGTNSTDTPFDVPDRVRGPGCSSLVNPGSVANYVKINCFALPAATPAIAAQCVPFGAPTAPIAGTCANLQGNAGRNSLIGPGLFDFDFSLFKNNYIPKISEGFDLQFRAEFFNLLNHPSFQAPLDTNQLFQATGQPVAGAGSLDTVTVTGREIQFGLKLIF